MFVIYIRKIIYGGVLAHIKVLEKFVGGADVRTIFMIECIKGKAIKPHSHYKEENEIILMTGTYMSLVNGLQRVVYT
jgi:hypothetical protein